MTEQEKYIADQKASGIEVGDTVRVVRKAESRSRGWTATWVCEMDENVGRKMKVRGLYESQEVNGINLGLNYHYFVLEIIKKANGTKPNNTNSERNSNMIIQEQTVSHVTIIERTEVLHEGSGIVQKINRKVLFDEKVSAVGDEAAKQKALSGLGVVDFDTLEITCKPFCSE